MYTKHQLWNDDDGDNDDDDDDKYYLSISGYPGSTYVATVSCRQKHILFFVILLTLEQSSW